MEPSRKKKYLVTFAILFMALSLVAFISKVGLWGALLPLANLSGDLSGRLQSTVSTPLFSMRHMGDVWTEWLELKEENRRLREETVRLKQELTAYREATIANERYKKLLAIKEGSPAQLVVANVVGADLTAWVWSISIDKGVQDGIAPDMPVMAGEGIIGRVIEPSMGYSKVLLLTDTKSAIAALVQRTRVQGILKGLGDGTCRLAYVEKSADVAEGDEIITSGMDKLFPKGFLLGRVRSVNKGQETELFQEIIVTPVADLKRMEEVAIQVQQRSILK
ncbi:MAG: rod shape-determining protein MreC [Deltaproteobacteria bacterium]|nr:rod shape-determining protein MreC [Deltaproteobacteria bacterium]